jgi:hypothetical protein
MKTLSLRQNERGAILVVGLLASVLLLGVLWTVMGIGESIAFRERGQTGADAVAFSTSVIQARGMNFLVLFNLLMAAILVIRVILRGILVIVVLFSWVPGVAGLDEPLITANETVDPWINRALDGLGMAGQGVMMMNSSFAMGTGNYVAKAYTPVVSSALVSSDGVKAGEEGVFPLPVKPDTFGGPLCAKSVGTMGDVFLALLQPMGLDGIVGPVVETILSPIETMVAALSPIFCGLGVNLTIPQDQLDQALQKQSQDCRDKVAKSGLQPGSQDYKNEMKKCDLGGNLYDSSKNTAASILMNILQGALDLTPPQSLEVADEWKNGYGQTIAVATLNPSLLKGNLALFGVSSTTGVPKGAGTAVAQSEYYYDCTGKWDDPACNGKKTPLGPGEAMWNFRWRARLVPVDTGSDVVKQFTDPMTADYQSALSRGGDPQTVQFFQSLSSYVEH